jgi:hypothetical protein
MRVYKVNYRTDDESTGATYHGELKHAMDAETRADLNGTKTEREEFDVEITREGILKALNRHGGHPDNG